MHPVTPALNAWKFVVAFVVVAAWQLGPQSIQGLDLGAGGAFLLIGILVGVGVVVAGAYSALAWRVTRYAIDAERVYVQSGVLFRRQRQARLDRIQAVDVVQPLLARIVGLAQLTIEQAGGQDSHVALAYLTEARAQEVRNELLARAAGIDVDSLGVDGLGADGFGADGPGAGVRVDPSRGVEPAGTAVPGPAPPDDRAPGGVLGPPPPPPPTPPPPGAEPTSLPGGARPASVARDAAAPPTRPRVLVPEAPEREVYAVPVTRLLGSIMLSGAMVALVLALTAIVGGSVVWGSFASIGFVLPALIGGVGVVWSRFSGEFAFRAAISQDGIRLRHGLTESRAQTVPPGRVQAVRLRQPLLWRGMDWWRVQMNVAGYADADAGKETVLLPVGTRAEALTALWLVLPDLGEQDPRPVLEAALVGRDDDAGFVPSPRRARWLDPIGRRRNGLRSLPAALLLRRGRFERQVDVVPHERTQSLGLTQGPLQRRLDLTSLVVHSTPGPVSPHVAHLDAARAAELLMIQAGRARTARTAAGPEQWMRPPT